MFPFNQSYRPRRISPDLPVFPVSNVHSSASRESPEEGSLEDHSYVPPSSVGRKNGKKRRVKTRPTPYLRPILPTPSSPSEAEYEPGREDNVVSRDDRIECIIPMHLYQDQPEDVSQRCERPQDENMHEEVMQDDVVIKSIAYEGVPEEGGGDDLIHHQVISDQVIEEVMQEEVVPEEFIQEEVRQEEVIQEEIMQEEVIQEEVSPDDVYPNTLVPKENPQEVAQNEETPDQVQDHVIEQVTPDNTVQNTIAQEILQDEQILIRIQQKVIQDNLFTKEHTVTEEQILENPMDKILNWGDLVVVEYAERRKTYQWPAIVHHISLFDIRLFHQHT